MWRVKKPMEQPNCPKACRPTRPTPRAFPSEVETGPRRENALKPERRSIAARIGAAFEVPVRVIDPNGLGMPERVVPWPRHLDGLAAQTQFARRFVGYARLQP